MASKTESMTGSASVEQNLKDMENRWAKASLSSNSAGLEAMLSDDFINLDADGTTHSKQETLARMSKSKFEVSELSDMQVTQHGDTAVVTGTWTGKGTDSMGKPIDTKERWADTWMKKNGKWMCIASASTTLKSNAMAAQ